MNLENYPSTKSKPMQEIKIELCNEEKTISVAKTIASHLKSYPKVKTLLLFGELGAGKTTFTRGFVSAFENAHLAEVSSPTFTLVNQYPTTPPIIHADIYRLAEMAKEGTYPEIPEDLEEALEEEKSYVLIEWAEYLDPISLPPQRLDIFLKVGNNTNSLVIKGNGIENDIFFQELSKKLNLL